MAAAVKDIGINQAVVKDNFCLRQNAPALNRHKAPVTGTGTNEIYYSFLLWH